MGRAGKAVRDGPRRTGPSFLERNALRILNARALSELFPESLLAYACRRAVEVQREYARRRGIPWGISEAAFSALDVYRIYQYRAFGVPGLGLKRGLEEDLVVAPYATALALAVDPVAAVENLRLLARFGLRGPYGFYESIDFTRERCPEGERGVIVYAYMAHHQGMSLVSLVNALLDGIMRRRFHADPRVKAAEAVLYERVPTEPPPAILPGGEGPPPRILPVIGPPARDRLVTANTRTPRAHLLANGEFFLMITNAGGGYLRWRDFDLTRWRADTTCDAEGEFIYLREVKEDVTWSAAYHPLGHGGRHYGVKFAPDRVEFRRHDAGIETVMEVVVAPEDPVEIRRISLINHTGRRRQVEVTSYLELALAPHAADRAHPAFNKLFVETELLPGGGLLARRRPRRPEEPSIFAAHLVVVEGPPVEVQYETDRARFLGRMRSPRDPAALRQRLSGTVGTVLDPIFSLRVELTLPPGQKIDLAFVTIAAETKEEVLALAERYRSAAAVENAVQHAWTHVQLELRHLGLRAEDVQRFQELAGHLLYPNPRLRPAGERLRRNLLGQTRLWTYGISGDLPIILVLVEDASELGVIREVLLAHAYLRRKGLAADLVILNGERASYAPPLQEELQRLLQLHSSLYTGPERPGGVFLRAINQMPQEDLALLLAIARVVLVAARGPLARQLAAPMATPPLPPRLKPGRRGGEEPSAPLPFLALPYFNGLGGFTPDGREYAVYLAPGAVTPASWANILANRNFGTMVSEAGGGFTWSENSQANRLTPWANDPVADPAGEILYLRDEETGVFWSPTPLPIRENDPYRARHGQGYTVFEHNSHAIDQELTVFVPVGEEEAPPVRLARLRLYNRSSRRRRLTVFAYNEWVLGSDREETTPHIVTKWDPISRAILARNTYRPEFGERVAFAALGPAAAWFTADRTEFIGRNGSLAHPAALARKNLSGRTGAGLDACAAQQIVLELEPGRAAEVIFLLGEAAGIEEARRLIRFYRDPARTEEALARTRAFWDRLLGTVQVRTPLPSVDFLLNRWLLYQTLSCRLWARSAFYQSGGAYGFRDQLQDVLALLHTRPELAREHILRAAGRQFLEGDVQHWWHPHSGAGTRTRCSDDLLWLVYATAHYVRVTGDGSILAERLPFLEGRPLTPEEDEVDLVPATAMEDGTLYEHCRRALERGLTAGPHGLPLIGSGDWNDGLNRVGKEGRGESVWLAWFLAEVLRGQAELAEIVGKIEDAKRYNHLAGLLVRAVEQEAWDGAWYRRAYFDDGTPLGAAGEPAAQIDSLAQSWAAIVGGDPDRVARALASVEKRLWWKEERLLPLFWPPFDEAYPADPGYIKAYPPGVRENGGQYNHAAVWLAMAFARRGDGERAVAVLQAINPVERTRNPEEVDRYKLEPYALAADIYTHPACRGRGGWSWYTGSSGWMYRVWLEEVLGFKRRGHTLRLRPAIPADWPGYAIVYRFGESVYEIEVERGEASSVELDGRPWTEEAIPLVDDGSRHRVRVILGPTGEALVPVEVFPAGKEEKGDG
ncbi:MAG: GH36-type glycosyl hydrolase domain-containing protein [Bacillota bacterium]